MAKNTYDYFDAFIKTAEYACEASQILSSFFGRFKKNEVQDYVVKIHNLEQSADEIKHEFISNISKEFITPFDREDMIGIADEIDNVIDAVDDVMVRVHLYNVDTVSEDAIAFVDLVNKCCLTLCEAIKEFKNYKKSKTIENLLIEVDHIEEKGDKMYFEATRRLYTESTDPVHILKWTFIINGLEKCCDSCEHVANVVRSVLIKNK